ncbi:hypothetical protein Tco_0233201 [Tanacetum coccineum]
MSSWKVTCQGAELGSHLIIERRNERCELNCNEFALFIDWNFIQGAKVWIDRCQILRGSDLGELGDDMERLTCEYGELSRLKCKVEKHCGAAADYGAKEEMWPILGDQDREGWHDTWLNQSIPVDDAEIRLILKDDPTGDEDLIDEDKDTRVGNSLSVASYACMISTIGSSCKGEKTSMSKRYFVKSFKELGELFSNVAGNYVWKIEECQVLGGFDLGELGDDMERLTFEYGELLRLKCKVERHCGVAADYGAKEEMWPIWRPRKELSSFVSLLKAK